MPTVALRRVVPADVPELADIVTEGFSTYASFAPEGWSAPGVDHEAERLTVLLSADSSYRAWVAIGDGRVLGFAGYLPATEAGPNAVGDARIAHVRHVFLRPAAWGRGVATDLLAQVVTDAAAAGFNVLRLFCAAGHARARRFYEREGFVTVGDVVDDTPLGLAIVEYRRPLRP